MQTHDTRTIEAMARMCKNFIPRKCSISYSNLLCWLTVEDFLKDVTFLMDEGAILDNRTLLNIMQNVYDKKFLENDTGFNFAKARRSMNSLKRAMNE